MWITKYIALFYSDGKYEKMFDKIRYNIMLKINISNAYSHKYMKIKIFSDNDLFFEITLNLVINVVIVVKSLFDDLTNITTFKYCYQIIITKWLYKYFF